MKSSSTTSSIPLHQIQSINGLKHEGGIGTISQGVSTTSPSIPFSECASISSLKQKHNNSNSSNNNHFAANTNLSPQPIPIPLQSSRKKRGEIIIQYSFQVNPSKSLTHMPSSPSKNNQLTQSCNHQLSQSNRSSQLSAQKAVNDPYYPNCREVKAQEGQTQLQVDVSKALDEFEQTTKRENLSQARILSPKRQALPLKNNDRIIYQHIQQTFQGQNQQTPLPESNNHFNQTQPLRNEFGKIPIMESSPVMRLSSHIMRSYNQNISLLNSKKGNENLNNNHHKQFDPFIHSRHLQKFVVPLDWQSKVEHDLELLSPSKRIKDQSLQLKEKSLSQLHFSDLSHFPSYDQNSQTGIHNKREVTSIEVSPYNKHYYMKCNEKNIGLSTSQPTSQFTSQRNSPKNSSASYSQRNYIKPQPVPQKGIISKPQSLIGIPDIDDELYQQEYPSNVKVLKYQQPFSQSPPLLNQKQYVKQSNQIQNQSYKGCFDFGDSSQHNQKQSQKLEKLQLFPLNSKNNASHTIDQEIIEAYLKKTLSSEQKKQLIFQLSKQIEEENGQNIKNQQKILTKSRDSNNNKKETEKYINLYKSDTDSSNSKKKIISSNIYHGIQVSPFMNSFMKQKQQQESQMSLTQKRTIRQKRIHKSSQLSESLEEQLAISQESVVLLSEIQKEVRTVLQKYDFIIQENAKKSKFLSRNKSLEVPKQLIVSPQRRLSQPDSPSTSSQTSNYELFTPNKQPSMLNKDESKITSQQQSKSLVAQQQKISRSPQANEMKGSQSISEKKELSGNQLSVPQKQNNQNSFSKNQKDYSFQNTLNSSVKSLRVKNEKDNCVNQNKDILINNSYSIQNKEEDGEDQHQNSRLSKFCGESFHQKRGNNDSRISNEQQCNSSLISLANSIKKTEIQKVGRRQSQPTLFGDEMIKNNHQRSASEVSPMNNSGVKLKELSIPISKLKEEQAEIAFNSRHIEIFKALASSKLKKVHQLNQKPMNHSQNKLNRASTISYKNLKITNSSRCSQLNTSQNDDNIQLLNSSISSRPKTSMVLSKFFSPKGSQKTINMKGSPGELSSDQLSFPRNLNKKQNPSEVISIMQSPSQQSINMRQASIEDDSLKYQKKNDEKLNNKGIKERFSLNNTKKHLNYNFQKKQSVKNVEGDGRNNSIPSNNSIQKHKIEEKKAQIKKLFDDAENQVRKGEKNLSPDCLFKKHENSTVMIDQSSKYNRRQSLSQLENKSVSDQKFQSIQTRKKEILNEIKVLENKIKKENQTESSEVRSEQQNSQNVHYYKKDIHPIQKQKRRFLQLEQDSSTDEQRYQYSENSKSKRSKRSLPNKIIPSIPLCDILSSDSEQNEEDKYTDLESQQLRQQLPKKQQRSAEQYLEIATKPFTSQSTHQFGDQSERNDHNYYIEKIKDNLIETTEEGTVNLYKKGQKIINKPTYANFLKNSILSSKQRYQTQTLGDEQEPQQIKLYRANQSPNLKQFEERNRKWIEDRKIKIAKKNNSSVEAKEQIVKPRSKSNKQLRYKPLCTLKTPSKIVASIKGNDLLKGIQSPIIDEHELWSQSDASVFKTINEIEVPSLADLKKEISEILGIIGGMEPRSNVIQTQIKPSPSRYKQQSSQLQQQSEINKQKQSPAKKSPKKRSEQVQFKKQELSQKKIHQ